MKVKKLILIALFAVAFAACKDSSEDVTPTPTQVTPKTSKLTLLCNDWTLKETYVDDKLQNDNGTTQYRFTKNGKFLFKENGIWVEIGSYIFNDKDSSSLTVNMGMGGATSEFWWYIKKLDAKSLNTEFAAGSQKLNYNYVR